MLRRISWRTAARRFLRREWPESVTLEFTAQPEATALEKEFYLFGFSDRNSVHSASGLLLPCGYRFSLQPTGSRKLQKTWALTTPSAFPKSFSQSHA